MTGLTDKQVAEIEARSENCDAYLFPFTELGIIDTDRSALLDDRRVLKAEIEKLREYAQHMPTCPANPRMTVIGATSEDDFKCNCELSALLETPHERD